MSVKERLKSYISYKKLTVNRFEKLCGFSNGFVNNMRVSMQPSKIEKIALNFPDLNTGWLLTGEGDMLKKEVGIVSEIDNFGKSIAQFDNLQNPDLMLTKIMDALERRDAEYSALRHELTRNGERIDKLIDENVRNGERIDKLIDENSKNGERFDRMLTLIPNQSQEHKEQAFTAVPKKGGQLESFPKPNK